MQFQHSCLELTVCRVSVFLNFSENKIIEKMLSPHSVLICIWSPAVYPLYCTLYTLDILFIGVGRNLLCESNSRVCYRYLIGNMSTIAEGYSTVIGRVGKLSHAQCGIRWYPNHHMVKVYLGVKIRFMQKMCLKKSNTWNPKNVAVAAFFDEYLVAAAWTNPSPCSILYCLFEHKISK